MAPGLLLTCSGACWGSLLGPYRFPARRSVPQPFPLLLPGVRGYRVQTTLTFSLHSLLSKVVCEFSFRGSAAPPPHSLLSKGAWLSLDSVRLPHILLSKVAILILVRRMAARPPHSLLSKGVRAFLAQKLGTLQSHSLLSKGAGAILVQGVALLRLHSLLLKGARYLLGTLKPHSLLSKGAGAILVQGVALLRLHSLLSKGAGYLLGRETRYHYHLTPGKGDPPHRVCTMGSLGPAWYAQKTVRRGLRKDLGRGLKAYYIHAKIPPTIDLYPNYPSRRPP